MKIAHITSGAAGMYCGSCMNANTMARALIDRGHDIALVPTYTPMRTDEELVAGDRIFFGALNVYLQQKVPFFRHTPRFVDWLLDRPALLRTVARWSGQEDMQDIGALMLSMLQGEEGRQAKELERLVAFLRDDFKPDVIHLSFAFFLGMARRLREELGVPIVSSVQGEEIMLDEIPEPYLTPIIDEMRTRAADVEALVAPCRFYGDFMQDLLQIEDTKMRVVPLGIDLDIYATDTEPADTPDPGDRPVVIGSLARICPEKGLHLLLDAFKKLTDSVGRERVELRVAGYLSPRDEPYLAEQKTRLDAWGIADRVHFAGEVDREEKVSFLRSLDVFSVPTVYREPKGISVIEAMAAGVPVVQPRHGAFPEMVEGTGGGLLVEPESADALHDGLLQLVRDASVRTDLARRARNGARARHGTDAATESLLALYRDLGVEG